MDDRPGALEVVVAEDMVDVVFGVDQVADRAMRLGQLAHRHRTGGQLGRVDDDHSI